MTRKLIEQLNGDVAQIQHSRAECFGSGRLIAPGLVLTARHVLEDDAGPVGDEDWQARLLTDYQSAETKSQVWAWHEAKVVWRGAGSLDLALLQFVETAYDPKPDVCVQFATLDAVANFPAVTFGFPRAVKADDGARPVYHANADLLLDDGKQPLRLVVPQEQAPIEPTDWRGISGAAVLQLTESIQQVSLFGCIQEVPPNFSVGMLKVARIDQAFQDPDFVNILRSALGSEPQLRSVSTNIIPPPPMPRSYEALRDAFVQHYLQAPFAGRKEDFASLDKWLAASGTSGPPLGLLVAPAGRGKSALVTRWVERIRGAKNLRVIFVPISSRYDTNRAETVLAVLAIELATLLNIHLELPSVGAIEAYRDITADLLHQFVRSGRNCLLVVDGADETLLAGWQLGQALLPAKPPRGLSILVTARPLAGDRGPDGWESRLGWAAPSASVATFDLKNLTLHDISGLLNRFSAKGPPAELTKIAERIFELSDRGDPLLAELYLADIDDWMGLEGRDFQYVLQMISRPNPGLRGYFDNWIEEQRNSLAGAEAAETTLVLLAQALGPLHHSGLMAVLQKVLAKIPSKANLLRPLARFIVGDGEMSGYALGHPRFGDFLRSEQYADHPLLYKTGRAFLDWGRDVVTELRAQRSERRHLPAYIILWYPRHVLQQKAIKATDVEPFLSREWVEGCRDAGAEAQFATNTEAILGALLEILSHEGKLDAGSLAAATRASLFLVSVRQAATRADVGLLVRAYEFGIFDKQALLDRKALLTPGDRVSLLLDLAEQGARDFDPAALWREAYGIALSLPLPESQRAINRVLSTGESVLEKTSASEQEKVVEELLAMVRQILASPLRWPDEVDTPPFPYWASWDRSELISMEHRIELTRIALDANAYPAFISALINKIATATLHRARRRRDESEMEALHSGEATLAEVFNALENDGRVGPMARFVSTAIASKRQGLPMSEVDMRSAAGAIVDDTKQVRALAALLGVLSAYEDCTATVRDLLLTIEEMAGPMSLVQYAAMSSAIRESSIKLPKPVLERAWSASLVLTREYLRLAVRTTLVKMASQDLSIYDLICDELVQGGPRHDLERFLKASASVLSTDQRENLLSKLKDSYAEQDVQGFAAALGTGHERSDHSPRARGRSTQGAGDDEDRGIRDQVREILDKARNGKLTELEFDHVHTLVEAVDSKNLKARMLSELSMVAPESKRMGAIREALRMSGELDDEDVAVQAIARFAEQLPFGQKEKVLKDALRLLANVDPLRSLNATCNAGWALTGSAQREWAEYSAATIGQIAPDTIESAKAMARVVAIFPQAPAMFVATCLEILARGHGKESGGIYRDLIGRRAFKTIPAVVQALQLFQQMSVEVRAEVLLSLLRRYPRALAWLWPSTRGAVAGIQDDELKLDRLGDLARQSSRGRRVATLSAAVDHFEKMLAQDDSASREYYPSQFHPIRKIYELCDRDQRERIRRAISNCDDSEKRFHYELCVFPALSMGEREDLGAKLLKRIMAAVTRGAHRSPAGLGFKQVAIICRYWQGPGRLAPLQALLRISAEIDRRSWFYGADGFIFGSPEMRARIGGAGVETVNDAVSLWP